MLVGAQHDYIVAFRRWLGTVTAVFADPSTSNRIGDLDGELARLIRGYHDEVVTAMTRLELVASPQTIAAVRAAYHHLLDSCADVLRGGMTPLGLDRRERLSIIDAIDMDALFTALRAELGLPDFRDLEPKPGPGYARHLETTR